MATNPYIVGGAVRDVLLGRIPKDLDYVWVGATPEYMLSFGYSQVGADFPVFLDGGGNEHALARKERKVAAGYNGFEVDFDSSVTLEEDLARRDLTINAMAVPVDVWENFKDGNHKLVIDPFGGQLDLNAGILRHVSDAFVEDPVRVLRVARFAARYKFGVSLSTVALMRELVDTGELDALVPERVWTEMERALMETTPIAFFRTLDMCGAAKRLFPEFCLDGFFETNLTDTLPDSRARFALTCLKLTEAEVNALCDRLKAPVDFRKLALRTNELVELFRKNLTAERVVSTLEKVGAFQDVSNANEALEVAAHSAFNTQPFRDRLLTVTSLLRDVVSVRFDNLTTDQQETLKGPEIGAALRKMRLNLVNQTI